METVGKTATAEIRIKGQLALLERKDPQQAMDLFSPSGAEGVTPQCPNLQLVQALALHGAYLSVR